MPRSDRREPRRIDGQLAAALMPATAEASSTPCMVCPITGPGARQMAESRDRCTPIPGPVRPMRRTTAGITEAWTTPQPGHPLIRRLPGDLPAADASPSGRAPPAGGLAHAHHPARADLTSMGGHRPVHAQQGRQPITAARRALFTVFAVRSAGGRPPRERAIPRANACRPQATSADAEPLFAQFKCSVSPLQSRLATPGR